MRSGKLKSSFLNFIVNFLIGDYRSWQFSNFADRRQQQSIDPDKARDDPQSMRQRKMPFETHTRAWVKSIVWRLAGIVILGFVSWFITHSWKEMTTITILFHGIRVILYYFHERIWEKIGWGRVKHPLSIFPVTKELEPEDIKTIQGYLRKLGYLD